MLRVMTRQKPWQWGKYVAVGLTTTACSLQDYAYLGQSDESTDTSGDASPQDDSETNATDASDSTSITIGAKGDAALPEAGHGGSDITADADVTDIDADTTGSTEDTNEPEDPTPDV